MWVCPLKRCHENPEEFAVIKVEVMEEIRHYRCDDIDDRECRRADDEETWRDSSRMVREEYQCNCCENPVVWDPDLHSEQFEDGQGPRFEGIQVIGEQYWTNTFPPFATVDIAEAWLATKKGGAK